MHKGSDAWYDGPMKNQKAQVAQNLKELPADIIAGGAIEAWLDECFAQQAYARGKPSSIDMGTSVVLHMILGQMAEVYPAITRENPDGTTWDGLALPDRVLAYTKNRNPAKLDFARGNLLDIAAERGATDDAIRMLIASGFDPTQFSYRVGMTPIGTAAFDANISALRLFAQAGFDLSLPMQREHTGDSGLVGSNLLHRLLQKRDIDSPQGLEVVNVLLGAGVDPLSSNNDGQTPLGMASGNIRVAMERWLASQQAGTLEGQVDYPSADPEAPKPRF